MLSHLVRLSLVVASLLAVAGCNAATVPPFEGTFRGTAVTPLPSPPLPMGDLDIEATLRLDADTDTFELDMALSVEAFLLNDLMNVRGDYVAANGAIMLEPRSFEPGTSTNTWEVVDGVPCITLAGFASTVVCMPPTEGEYAGDTITLTLAHQIAGVDGTTPITLTRVP